MEQILAVPLEDELGDVLEKAARHAALTYEAVAKSAQVDLTRILDAIDYRPDLTADELTRLARVLELNEVGLNALARGAYPQPKMQPLPFGLFPLRMPFGVGVVNAYIVSTDGESGVLFDTGASGAEILRHWPSKIRKLQAVFVTHYEAEHIGGLDAVMDKFALDHFYGPATGRWPKARGINEGQSIEVAGLTVRVMLTPGHAAEHNCYVVSSAPRSAEHKLLVSGDLIFAGSLGGGYFCCQRQLKHARRVLGDLTDDTLIAPGHGPFTTAGIERRFNPFLQ